MTEHGKNAGNRASEFEGHAATVKKRDPGVYVFAVCIVNAADVYYSPTEKPGKEWHTHSPDGRTSANRAISTLHDRVADAQVDLLATPVVVANNDPDSSLRRADWLRRAPQPPDGDEHAWGHFVEHLAHACSVGLKQ